MQLLIFIGIQGAGKSTFYALELLHTHVRLNKDMLKTNHRMQLLFETCLTSKTKTVIDKTNPTRSDRADYIAKAKDAQFEVVAYYFDVPFDVAVKRNDARTGKARIPIIGIKGVAKSMQRPSFEEGFDKIYIVKISADGYTIIEDAPPTPCVIDIE